MSAMYSVIKQHLLDCFVTQKLVQVFPLISGQAASPRTSTFPQIQGEARAELPTGVTSSVA